MIDNSNNEIRGGGVKRDAGGDEKQLIKFVWPKGWLARVRLALLLRFLQRMHNQIGMLTGPG